MKISFRERRSSKYQNRIFVLFIADGGGTIADSGGDIL